MSSSPKHQIFSLAGDIAQVKDQLRLVLETLGRLDGGGRSSFTLAEWRARHGLSESQYHKLRRQGRGPRTMQTGDVGVRVSVEADIDWVRDRERDAAERHQHQGEEAAE
jgi:hypothetical protein